MATQKEQKIIRSTLDNQRQTLVRLVDVNRQHPRLKREADYGDIAANAVLSYYELLGLVARFDFALAGDIEDRDKAYLDILEEAGLWPDDSLLAAARGLVKA